MLLNLLLFLKSNNPPKTPTSAADLKSGNPANRPSIPRNNNSLVAPKNSNVNVSLVAAINVFALISAIKFSQVEQSYHDIAQSDFAY